MARLLGREPSGEFEVVVRNEDGEPMVIRNAPFLFDGTPMPTVYWLCDPELNRRISRLEADGGVRRAETEIPPQLIEDAHRRHALLRDSYIRLDAASSERTRIGAEVEPTSRPVPTGGVAGTRTGVKCLHAHYAWHLAGGDDPVGRWVEEKLAR